MERLRAATQGEFEILREIGRGGMARVYLARERALRRDVALKVLSPLFSEYPEIVRRFEQEARTAGKLNHPNIVPVFAVYQRDELSFFSMPYVSGPSLRRILKEQRRLELDEALDYLAQAARGLAYAHERGVVHRDVKPENILREDATGRVVMTDFGLAKALGAESLTVPGDMIGTPHYMSPEQCDAESDVDGRGDQYSLALVAYEMLAGGYPFESEGLRDLLMKQLQEYPPPLIEVRPELPWQVCKTIDRALSKDPDDRFPTIEEFWQALHGEVEVLTPRPALESGERGAEVGDAETLLMRDRLTRRRRLRRLKGWARRGAVVVGTVVALAAAGIVLRGVSTDRNPVASTGDPEGGAELRFFEEPAATAPIVGPAAPGQDAADDGPTTVRTAGVGRGTTSGPSEDPTPSRDPGRQVASRRSATGSPPDRTRETRGPAIPDPADERTAEPTDGTARPVSRRAGRQAEPGMTDAASREAESTSARETADPEALEPPTGSESASSEGSGAAPTAGDEKANGASAGSGAPSSPDAEPSELKPLAPKAAVEALLERYRSAFEDENFEALAREVYGGPVPDRDRKMLSQIFEPAEELELSLVLKGLRRDADRRTVEVEHRMEYLLARTRRPQSTVLTFEMSFEADDSGWHLVRLRH